MTTSAAPSTSGRSASPLRIVVLGDSLAAGTGDESGRGIAGHLAGELALAGRDGASARTLGVRGATTQDLLARLEHRRDDRDAVASADALVLSIGANDLFRTPGAREQAMSAPLQLADAILARVERVVQALRALNPRARILVLGGYNPAPGHGLAFVMNGLVRAWDDRLARRFAADPAIGVVKIADLLAGRDHLSRLDGFHPGGVAYQAMARRIADQLASC